MRAYGIVVLSFFSSGISVILIFKCGISFSPAVCGFQSFWLTVFGKRRSHDVMAAIFVSQNNETAAMFVSQTSPVGVELFSYVNVFFCSNKFA